MTETTDYFNSNDLASSVWAGKYALKIDGKQAEDTPDEMHWRMAREFARIELKYPNPLFTQEIYSLFEGFKAIIPQGSVMSQLGNPTQIGSLSNCIVLPKIHDSYGGIIYTDQQLAQVMKRRCGVGIDISTLRPSGTIVSNAAQTSTGAVSFMHRFSNTTREVAQDGRRGALMITMDVRHPDIEQFITIKEDLTKVTGANISIKITDEFMKSVEGKGDNWFFNHRFPIDSDMRDVDWRNGVRDNDGYLRGTNGTMTKSVYARELWDKIIGAAHKSAEPGLIFWDRQHYYSPSSIYPEFVNISTNPCSEIAMGNDSCRLIAINMFSCVVFPFTNKAYFDFDQWRVLNYNAMRLMDDLVDLEIGHIDRIVAKIHADSEPKHIKQVELDTWNQLAYTGIRGRRTGLGYTALGDTLAALGFKYDSDEALNVFEEISRVKLEAELNAGIDLAEQRGAFPAFDADLEAQWAERPNSFFYMLKKEYPTQWTRMQRVGRRNISWSTVAPTGSLSLLAQLGEGYYGTTGGIEPLFKVYHIRRKKINPNDKDSRIDFIDASGDKWQEYPVFHEGFKMWYQINHPENCIYDLNKKELDLIIKESPYGGSQADEINWIKRVELQAIAQKYITHSISSTINLPNNVTTEEVSEIYMESWRKGLKGITIYRDGSRSGVLITESSKKPNTFDYHDAPKRPKELKAELNIVSVKGERYAVLVGLLDSKPYEIFAFNANGYEKSEGIITKVKKNHYTYTSDNVIIEDIQELASNADEQVLTRLVSGMLRHGVNPKFILQQIEKCKIEIVSFGKAMSRAIKKYISDKDLLTILKCKNCGSTNVRHEEGCYKCSDCGDSRC